VAPEGGMCRGAATSRGSRAERNALLGEPVVAPGARANKWFADCPTFRLSVASYDLVTGLLTLVSLGYFRFEGVTTISLDELVCATSKKRCDCYFVPLSLY
jgi:hypothetical protein